ncbi:MAG: DNA polymerase III subunit beta, partial [Bacteroidetes bacterium]|nr:DNA polymerase III subunit beta [Bacteroidota bacterium]
MNFIVSSTQLLRQLQTLSGVLNSSNTLPILDHILFELHPGQLRLTATDLETTISASLQVEATQEGKIAVPARLLLDTLKTFPE